MYSVDLNSDMGESFGVYTLGNDEELLKYITAANVACGWHAGDPMVMDKVVRIAKERGVVVGAHPSFPDRMGFGRRRMIISPAECKNYIKYQVGALSAFTTSYGLKIHHISCHGALGNMLYDDEKLAKAVCEAVAELDPNIIVYHPAGDALGRVAEQMGLPTASQIFADRAYEDDLSLRPRGKEGAMITDENVAIARVIRMVKEGKVTGYSGKELAIKGDTITVHGDGPKAILFVQKIREAFAQAGIAVKPFEAK